LCDEETGYVFSDIMEVNTLELPKLPKAPEQAKDVNLWNWAALLAARKEDELDMLAQRSPEIGKVVGLLKELSADEAIRMQYEAREKALRDDKARIRFAEKAAADRARSEGKDEEKREIAEKLLKLHAPLDMILEATGLSFAEIVSLQGQMA
jgi:predicted transposase/invertase (TIGR01784 family)